MVDSMDDVTTKKSVQINSSSSATTLLTLAPTQGRKIILKRRLPTSSATSSEIKSASSHRVSKTPPRQVRTATSSPDRQSRLSTNMTKIRKVIEP